MRYPGSPSNRSLGKIPSLPLSLCLGGLKTEATLTPWARVQQYRSGAITLYKGEPELKDFLRLYARRFSAPFSHF